MLNSRDTNQGLIKLLVDENVSDEMITRIIADFVMAAGDTVFLFKLSYLPLKV